MTKAVICGEVRTHTHLADGGGTHLLFIALGHLLLVLRRCPSGWGTRWKSLSGRIHAWHGLVRKAGPPGHIVLLDNFNQNKVSTRRCFSAVMFSNVDTTPLSICADDLLFTGMGPGNAGGRALPNLIFDMLVSWGRSNGCIGNDPPMDRGTTRLCPSFPTTLVHWGTRR